MSMQLSSGSCDPDFELARQVSWSIQWFDIVSTTFERLFAGVGIGQPKFVIGGCLRRERGCQLVSQLFHRGVDLVAPFGGTAHDVAVDVPASSQGGQSDIVDPLDRWPKIIFQYAMKLNRLPRRDLHRRIAKLFAKIQHREHLAGRDSSTRDPEADHHRIGFAAATLLGR